MMQYASRNGATRRHGFRFARVRNAAVDVGQTQADDELPAVEDVRPWLLPSLATRLAGGQAAFLAELRPTVALFLHFAGLDFIHDEDVGDKLDAFVSWAQRIVAGLGGALIQVTTGDKGSYLYASFGATQAHADNAERAAAAGLALLEYRTVAPWLTGHSHWDCRGTHPCRSLWERQTLHVWRTRVGGQPGGAADDGCRSWIQWSSSRRLPRRWVTGFWWSRSVSAS